MVANATATALVSPPFTLAVMLLPATLAWGASRLLFRAPAAA